MGSKFIEQNIMQKKLLQNFETPRKQFSLILKLTKHIRERERERERAITSLRRWVWELVVSLSYSRVSSTVEIIKKKKGYLWEGLEI